MKKDRLSKTEEGVGIIVLNTLSLLQHPVEFIGLLENFPFKIADDVRVKVALQILRHLSMNAKNRMSKWSEVFFRNAGLTLFIPKHPKNRTSSFWLLFWQQEPSVLIKLIQGYERRIKPFLRSRYASSEEFEKKNDIERALKAIFKKPMPKNLLLGGRDKDLTDIALTFTHHAYNVQFEALKKLYYKKSINKSNQASM